MNVWGIRTMDQTPRRFVAFTKEDCRKLQVVQNKVLRLKTGLWDHHTPTEVLLEKSGDLSVHQLGAYQTIMTGFKAIRFGKPKHLSSKLVLRKPTEFEAFPWRKLDTIDVLTDPNHLKIRICLQGSSNLEQFARNTKK